MCKKWHQNIIKKKERKKERKACENYQNLSEEEQNKSREYASN